MSDLADLVEAFKREVAVPGTFATEFPSTTDDHIVGALADAFAEAQLDGYFGVHTLDVDTGEVLPDLSTAGAGLIVMYAGMRMIRHQLRAMNINTRYKAGPVEYETAKAASALTEELKQLAARRDQLITAALRAGRNAGATFVLDGYLTRLAQRYYGGFFAGELVGSRGWAG